jgi:hypothetical protein
MLALRLDMFDATDHARWQRLEQAGSADALCAAEEVDLKRDRDALAIQVS